MMTRLPLVRMNSPQPRFGGNRLTDLLKKPDPNRVRKPITRKVKVGGAVLAAITSMLGISQVAYGNPWELSQKTAETGLDVYYTVKYQGDAEKDITGIPSGQDAKSAAIPEFAPALEGVDPLSFWQDTKLDRMIDFQHFKLTKNHTFKRIRPDANEKLSEDIVKQQIAYMYADSPNVTKELLSLPEGLEIHLFHGVTAFHHNDGSFHAAGTATREGSVRGVVRIITGPLAEGVDNDALLAHEMGHIDDALENVKQPGIVFKVGKGVLGLLSDGNQQPDIHIANSDGLLPGKSSRENKKYIEAREVEKSRIAAFNSPLNGENSNSTYALTNDVEFFAVLRETYVNNPDGLKSASPELYDYVDSFYNPPHPWLTLSNIADGGALLLIGGVLVRVKRKRKG